MTGKADCIVEHLDLFHRIDDILEEHEAERSGEGTARETRDLLRAGELTSLPN